MELLRTLQTCLHSRVNRDRHLEFAASAGRAWKRQRGIRMGTDVVQGPVFVAGASGRVVQRIVRELAAAGMCVRAGFEIYLVDVPR